MTYDTAILRHLRRRSITPAIAYTKFRCLALHSAISRLRDVGHKIKCTREQKGTKHWGRYTLKRKK